MVLLLYCAFYFSAHLVCDPVYSVILSENRVVVLEKDLIPSPVHALLSVIYVRVCEFIC